MNGVFNLNILVINGSPRTQSRTRAISQEATSIFQSNGVKVLNFDTGFHKLPLFSGTDSDRENSEVKRLLSYAEQADGFFICTPEYHNGMSGALKNALDFLGGSHFKGKPVAIAACSGGGKGGINALNNLRLVMRGVYGIVLPEQYIADPNDFNEKSQFVSEIGRERIQSIAKDLMYYTNLLVKEVTSND